MLQGFKKAQLQVSVETMKENLPLINQYVSDFWQCDSFILDRDNVSSKKTYGEVCFKDGSFYLELGSRYQILIEDSDLDYKTESIVISVDKMQALYKKAKSFEVLNEFYERLPSREKRCEFMTAYSRLPEFSRLNRLMSGQTLADVKRMMLTLKRAGGLLSVELMPGLEIACDRMQNQNKLEIKVC